MLFFTENNFLTSVTFFSEMKPRETDNISTCWQHFGRCSAWQHVNMLSIFRGEPSNIQYQYLGEAKTTNLHILMQARAGPATGGGQFSILFGSVFYPDILSGVSE